MPCSAGTLSPTKTAYIVGGKYMFVNLLGALVCIGCGLLIMPVVTKDVVRLQVWAYAAIVT